MPFNNGDGMVLLGGIDYSTISPAVISVRTEDWRYEDLGFCWCFSGFFHTDKIISMWKWPVKLWFESNTKSFPM